MKRLLFLMLVAGLGLSLIPGSVSATGCDIFSPANTTFTNASAPRFEVRCHPNVINWSWAAGVGKVPQVNISFSNGSFINQILNLTIGEGNFSAVNVSGSYVALPEGGINATFFLYNTSSNTLIRLQRLFTVDTLSNQTVTVNSPTNRTYTSGAMNITCSSANSSNFTYSVDGGAAVTLSATSVKYKEGTTATLADGAHNIACTAIKATNSLSNTSATAYFFVNSSAPEPRIIHPLVQTAGNNIFPIDTAGLNVSWSLNWSLGGAVMALNISNITITLPTLFTDSPATGAVLSNISGSTNLTTGLTRKAALVFVINTTNTSAAIVNGSTERSFGLAFNSSVVAATEGDGDIVITYNVSTPGGIYTPATDTISVKVRNVSKGPFYVNNTCGVSVTETRTANKTTFTMANASPCNITFIAPYLTPGNATLTNTTLYGWKCTYPCLATNASANSSRFGLITMYVPDNSTTVTVEKADLISTAGWPGGVAGTAGAAGLAVIFYGAYRVHRGRRKSKEGR